MHNTPSVIVAIVEKADRFGDLGLHMNRNPALVREMGVWRKCLLAQGTLTWAGSLCNDPT